MTEEQQIVEAFLLSLGLSIIIIGYHIFRSYRQAKKEKIKIRKTKSFVYILTGVLGMVLFAFLSLVLFLCFSVFKNIDSFLEIAANSVLFIFLLFPILFPLFVFFYTQYFQKNNK